MKNQSNRVNRTTGFIAAFAIALGLAAVPASAQQGTFNLPVPAHWGKVFLQPGEHKVEIPIPVGQTLVYLSSDTGTKVTVPLTTDPRAPVGRSYLHLVKVDGVYYVDQYMSGVTGTKFFFPKPKSHQVNTNPEEADAAIIKVHGN